MNVAPLSIVTITCNDAEGLRRTLESVAGQTLRPAEILVVDNLSGDSTPAVVTSFSELPIRYVREADSGVYDAMNKGWRRGSQPFVQFLNSGDVFSRRDALAILNVSLANLTEGGWLTTGAVQAGERDRVIRNIPHSWWRHALGLQSHCHQACIFSRSQLVALDGLSEDYSFAGDFDYILRAGLVRQPSEVNEILVHYEGGGMSATRWREIPRLLHHVRVDRLQLSQPWKTLDLLWAHWRLLHRRLVELRGSRQRPSG